MEKIWEMRADADLNSIPKAPKLKQLKYTNRVERKLYA